MNIDANEDAELPAAAARVWAAVQPSEVGSVGVNDITDHAFMSRQPAPVVPTASHTSQAPIYFDDPQPNQTDRQRLCDARCTRRPGDVLRLRSSLSTFTPSPLLSICIYLYSTADGVHAMCRRMALGSPMGLGTQSQYL